MAMFDVRCEWEHPAAAGAGVAHSSLFPFRLGYAGLSQNLGHERFRNIAVVRIGYSHLERISAHVQMTAARVRAVESKSPESLYQFPPRDAPRHEARPGAAASLLSVQE